MFVKYWRLDNGFICRRKEYKKLKEKVGDRKVLCALSGGVDSSVAAVLVHKAIGKQLNLRICRPWFT